MTSQKLGSTKLPLPALQDGDVVIYTSHHPSGIFLLHKDVLSTNSRCFKAALSQEWGRYPQSGKCADSPKVYEMDLEFDLEAHLALPVVRVSVVVPRGRQALIVAAKRSAC